MVCLGLLMLSTYRYPPSAGVMSKCSSHYQCTIFFPLRNDSSFLYSTPVVCSCTQEIRNSIVLGSLLSPSLIVASKNQLCTSRCKGGLPPCTTA